ncbi:putative oxidoreductase, SDR family [Nocardia nova SH22a]|uniref:Putative oxidoreductase, SDR family n=1 Tax=Nocardia nova SH22a TaxID=1415166 RepID=W5TMH5_9NOCA|nr:SDR family oxidoreductase [Nocardia nova]AHH18421.1 putative oxidoreductase, SDR family [Nocardia nova SH22a]
MGTLDGRVAIITGAGRGLGREHALLFAAEGAKVVVNDLGGTDSPAYEVVAEIRAAGGEAVANGDSVVDWDGAKRMVDQAVEEFGDLHVVVNNAGILRDRTLVNMSEEEWDSVIAVHLKGHFCLTRHAAAYWREQSKAGATADRSLVHTSSTSGLFANPGQGNYGAAKSGIATFSQIVAKELGRYGVRSNSIAPAARTRLTSSFPGIGEEPADLPEGGFDEWHPGNVSPMIAYLATEKCPFTGETFNVVGGYVTRIQSWSAAESLVKDQRWTVSELVDAGPDLAGADIVRPAMPQ